MINKNNIIKCMLLTCLSCLQSHASDSVIINGLQWQNNKESKELRKNWNGARNYCENLTLEGHNDWSLPTIRELQSLVDLRKYRPAVQDAITEISVLTFYWSSTPYRDDTKKAWHMFYKYGESYYGNKGERYGVRCVRGRS